MRIPQTSPGSPHLSNTQLMAMCAGWLITLGWFLLTWRYGFDFADEGYYWYGAQRVLRGEVPMRDFMAYDMGRYYWSAAIMQLLHDDGIFGARAAAVVYQGIAVSISSLLAMRATEGYLGRTAQATFVILVAFTITLWVYPYYKVFDFGTSILIIAMITIMLSSRNVAAWFWSGIILGLAAIMGRNHGVYGAFGGLLAIVFILLTTTDRPLIVKLTIALIIGTIVGFSPTLAMAIWVPGFAEGFIASVRDLIRSGATNIALAVPWPWTVPLSDSGWVLWGMRVAKGVAFIAIIAFPALAIAVLCRQRHGKNSFNVHLALAAAFAGLPYAHYAYSRADLTHLSLAIPPLLLLLFSIGLFIRRPVAVAIGVLGCSLLTLSPEKPFLANKLLSQKLETVEINGSQLHVYPGAANRLRSMNIVFAALPTARDSFLALPDMTAAYAIEKTRMPIWEIYSLFPRDKAFEAPELARLRATPPTAVILSNHALDRRPQLRFSAMHPEIQRWIFDNYERATALRGLPDPQLEVYVRKFSGKL